MKKLTLKLGGYEIGDPLETMGGKKFDTLADIINALVPYVFALAGLLLLLLLIWGGFDLLCSGGDPEKVKSAQSKITNALIGFIIIFAAYWILQILQVILGFKIWG